MTSNKHHCKAPDDQRNGSYGAAVTECIEDEDGNFWVDNGEYQNTVRYCPFCGAKAPNQKIAKAKKEG